VESFAIKVIRSLEADAFPTIGARPINDIKPPEVLAMLRKVEARGALETLKRVRQRVADVFTFAIAERACARTSIRSAALRRLSRVPRLNIALHCTHDSCRSSSSGWMQRGFRDP
jgi:integrase